MWQPNIAFLGGKYILTEFIIFGDIFIFGSVKKLAFLRCIIFSPISPFTNSFYMYGMLSVG